METEGGRDRQRRRESTRQTDSEERREGNRLKKRRKGRNDRQPEKGGGNRQTDSEKGKRTAREGRGEQTDRQTERLKAGVLRAMLPPPQVVVI